MGADALPARSGGPQGPPGPRRGGWWKVAVPVGVAAIVLGALVGTGAISFGSSGPALGVTFSHAEATSVLATEETQGGSWQALGAFGVEVRSPTELSTSNVSSLLGSNCTLSALSETLPPSSVVIPAFEGSFSSGLAPFWVVFVVEPTTGTVVVVEVLDGSAMPLAQVGGSHCPTSAAEDHPLPSTVADSAVVAGETWSTYGSSWVAGDPNLTSVTLAVFGGGSYEGLALPGSWGVVYAPCDPLLGGTTEVTAFVAVTNLTGGGLTSFSDSLDCPS